MDELGRRRTLRLDRRITRHNTRHGPILSSAGASLLRLQTFLRQHGLLLQSPSYAGEVVIAMPNGVILEQELAREWGIGVERHRSGLIELLVA
jgi:hypothetical protein